MYPYGPHLRRGGGKGCNDVKRFVKFVSSTSRRGQTTVCHSMPQPCWPWSAECMPSTPMRGGQWWSTAVQVPLLPSHPHTLTHFPPDPAWREGEKEGGREGGRGEMGREWRREGGRDGGRSKRMTWRQPYYSIRCQPC